MRKTNKRGSKSATKKSCWKGYKKKGTKIKGGKRVNNCIKK